MELYQLRTFVTVADVGNLTHAAERLFTSQPTISAHIKALEQELNVRLFDRIPKGMRLTAHGHILIERAHNVLNATNELQIEASSLSGKLAGSVKIGLNTNVEFLRLSQLHQQLTTDFPQLKVHLTEGISAELLHEIRRGSLDGSFYFGKNKLTELESIPLIQTTIVIAAATKWKQHLNNASAIDLVKLPWIYPVPFCPYHQFLENLFKGTTEKPNRVADASSENSMNLLLRSGVGLAFIRLDEAQPWVDEGLITIWKKQSFSLPLNFAYLKRRQHDPLIQALRHSVLESFSAATVDQ
jgi:DNA-binding transcriptional LysR family regulator